MAVVIIGLQVGGSLAIITGRGTWLGTGAMGVFAALATLIGHAFWTIPDPMARFHGMNAFTANLSLIGGLVLAAVLTEGRPR